MESKKKASSSTKKVTKTPAKKVVSTKAESKKEVKKDSITKEVKPVKKNKKKFSLKKWFEGLTLNQIAIGGFIIVIILLIVLIAVSYRNTKTKNGSDIVVKVNGKTVTADDLYSKLKDQYGRSYAIDIIDNYIINKEIKTTSDMKKSAESTIKSYKSQYGDQYSSLISYYGASNDAEFKELIIKQNKLTTITKNYIKENLTEKEMKAYYQSSIVGDIRASHILISFNYASNATDAEKTAAEEAAKTKAEAIIEKLNNGEDFATLAKEYSEDTGTKENGGDLGYFNKGQMEEAFETAAYALDLNKYTTEPVKTSYGYHIILKTAQKDKPTYKASKDTIISDLVESKISDTTVYYKALDDLRKKYNMKIKDKTIKNDYKSYIKEATTPTTTTTTTAEATSNATLTTTAQ